MLYKAEMLNQAARRHVNFYLKRLSSLCDMYTSDPNHAISNLRKIMPQVQQAHTWLQDHYEADPTLTDLLVDMTAGGNGCVRMVVSPHEWGKWVTAGMEAATLAGRDLEHLEFTLEQGTHAFRQGDLNHTLDVAHRGVEAATALDATVHRAQCHYLRALVYQKQGDIQAAHDAIIQAQHDYERANDAAGIGKVRSFMAQAAIDALEYEQAYELLRQNIELWEQTGNLRQMAVEQYQLGVMFSNRLLFDEGDHYLLAARDTFQQLADRRYEAYSLQILSSNSMERDLLAEALDYIEDAHDLFQAVNDQRGVAGSLNYMGRIHEKRGALEYAIVEHQRAADVAGAINYHFALTDAHRSLALVYLQTNNPSAAREHIHTAVTVGETSGNRLLLLAVLTAAVGVLAADDRPQTAADMACTIQAETDEPIIRQMLETHLPRVEVQLGTAMPLQKATELIKNLYR